MGSKRNKPCRCGSGKKFKRCCGKPFALPVARLTRTCGACRACCTVLGEPSLGLDAYEQCPHEVPEGWILIDSIHQGGRGCARYSKRPQECRDYRCLWKQGLLAESERPDRIGIVVDTTVKLCSRWLGHAYHVREIELNASDRLEAQQVTKRLADAGAAVFVLRPNGRSKFASADPVKWKMFMEIMKRTKEAE